uniref:TipJ family phage tail tip protein n=1 Tax=Shewanella sp. TaxID=50422 RepID=UPI0040481840
MKTSLLTSQSSILIQGEKGGSSGQTTPVESPDDLRSIAKAKILLAIGEGEFEGQLTGQNVFLDGTPILDANGAENFPGVIWDFRPGSLHQTYIPGLPSLENETAVGIELKSSQPYTRAITNSLLSAVRVRLRWPALQQQLDNGDVTGYRITYAIDLSTDGGEYETLLNGAVNGKTTQAYERSHRVDLPQGNNWQIRIRRLTANQNNNRVADTMQIAAITDVIDRKLKYPNTALLYVEFDASQFQNIPVISCEPYMRKIKVPTNYDPITRSYTGTWDGSFKIAWSDNPAWISYDIILDDRFGTGRRINASLVDKWELYNIAQYCDQLVPDGSGGSEPRYVCNIYIQQATEAWQVLRDLASIYRGMTYWSNGQMYTVADMPRDVDYIYNNSNVIDGRFSYSSSSEKVKYTRALISWDNPENAYESDVTSVSEQSLQRRYGDNVVELAALGCTRESEAQRRGKWAIYTNNNDRTVTFKVGLDGSIPMPGFVIGVGDKLIAGNRIGGRITAVNGNKITLDQVGNIAVNDRLIINLPSGKAQARTIKAINGREVTVTTAYSETPKAQLLWSVESDELKLQQFRVLRVGKAESDSIEYEITAVEHNPGKFSYIDTGARLEERPISKLPIGAQESPASVTLCQSIFTEQTISVTTLNIQWETAKNAVAYEVEWRKDDGEWITLPKVYSTSVDIRGVYTGRYLARVRAINSSNVKSIARESELKAITGKDSNDHLVSNLSTLPGPFEIVVNWAFPVGSEDTLFTELQMASDIAGSNTKKIADIAYPINSYSVKNLPRRTVQFFRASLVDKAGNHGEWSNWIRGEVSDVQSDYDALFGETFKVYTWFAWADDNAGTGFTTVETQGEGKNYLGVATEKKTSIPSGNWQDYTWTKIKTEIPPVFTPEEEAQLDNLMLGKLPTGDKDMLAAQDALNNPALANDLITSLALLSNGIDAASLNGETPAGAQSKANTAQSAAEAYALAKANLAETTAKAHADGKVTAEETRAIADAQAKADAAKTAAIAAAATDATTKANNAKAAAETYALAKANLAEVTAKAYADGKVTAEESRAITDAQAKADAAKTAAIAAAATDATTKANNAKAQAEANAALDALNKASAAKADAINVSLSSPLLKNESYYRTLPDPFFEKGMLAYSANYTGTSESLESLPIGTRFSVIKAGEHGGNVLRVQGDAWIYGIGLIPIDTSKRYKLKFKVKQHANGTGNRLVYAGVVTLDKDLNAISGGVGLHRYCAVSGASISEVEGWHTFEGYITSVGTTAHNQFRANTAYIRPVCIVNYSGGNGVADIDELSFYEVTEKGDLIEIGMETSTNAQAKADAAKTAAIAAAATDATTKANNAKAAAETYALAKANLAEVTAKAYADGKVTAEEARAIADAQAKADAAKNAAISTAANDATAKANAAKSQAEATAALDALNKANAARNDAISAAANDATTKANNARNAAMAQSGGPNLLSLSTFTQDGNKGGWSSGNVVQISSLAGASTLDGRTHALALNTRDSYEYQNIIPVTGGEVLYWGMWVNTQLTSQGVNFGYRKVINGSSQNSWPAALSLAPGQGWTWVQGSLVIQSDSTAIIPFLQISATSNYGTPLVQDLVISRSPIRAGALAAKDSLNAGDVGADPAGSATAVLQAVDALGLKSLGSYIDVMGSSCGHHTTGDWDVNNEVFILFFLLTSIVTATVIA